MRAQGGGHADSEEGKRRQKSGRRAGTGKLDGHVLALRFLVSERGGQAVQDGGEGSTAFRADAPAGRQEAEALGTRTFRERSQVVGDLGWTT